MEQKVKRSIVLKASILVFILIVLISLAMGMANHQSYNNSQAVPTCSSR